MLGSLLFGILASGCTGAQKAASPGAGSKSSSYTQSSAAQGKPSENSEAFVLSQPKARTIPVEDPNATLRTIRNLRAVGMLTGEDSINKTRTNYNVGGTDLGIFIYHKNRMYIAFGDTFSGDGEGDNMTGDWRSNTMAYTTDLNASDGIRFDGMISNSKVGDKKAIELLSSDKVDNDEMTVIPTGGISLGNTMYLAFMSVKHWGVPGSWDVNYGGLAKSTDDGQTWQKLDAMKWTDSNFAQLCPLVVGDYVYFYGIPGGRSGGLKIMRVKSTQIENMADYEYLSQMDSAGNPVFCKGNASSAMQVVEPDVGEPCVVYNSYLNEYLLTYLSGNTIGLRAAKHPWGPWSKYTTFVSSDDYPQLYGGFMNSVYTGDGGRIIYFTMSLYGDYNVALMSITLSK